MRLIDADALNGYKFGLISPYVQNLFHKTINEAPTIVQEQRTGHWIDTGSGQECSECGEIQYGYDNFRNYCANCGAKMQEVEE